MIYEFEIRESDKPGQLWLIVKREEKTDGFYLKTSDLNNLRIKIDNYFDKKNK